MSKASTRKLTSKEELFVREYLVDLNATGAAVRAGYSQRTARQISSRLLTKQHVQAALKCAMEARRKRLELDADWILERLKMNVERSLQAIPVVGSDGTPTGEFRYEGAVANQALKLIGDHIGFFKSSPEEAGGKSRHVFIVAGQRVEF